ncbi:hypothetical protein [Virgibacillus ainsalahensis]
MNDRRNENKESQKNTKEFLNLEQNDDINSENESDTKEFKEIDVLNLPPRKEIHSTKKKRTHFKINFPLVRFLVVIIILLCVITGVYFVWEDAFIQFINIFNFQWIIYYYPLM